MSSFANLNTALSALNAQRRAMEVAGKNIANANTDGYTRQRVNLRAVGAAAVPALYSTYTGAGGGVSADNVERLRDTLLEVRAGTEHGRQETLTTQQSVLSSIEQVFGEPSDQGLQSQLGEFWNSWHDVSNAPGDSAARTQLLQRAGTLADSLNQTDGSLNTIWLNHRERLGTLVDEANTAATNVAELNQAIQRAQAGDMPCSELADQRDMLVVRLAELVGATTRTGDNGAVDVYLGATALVRGPRSEPLTAGGSFTLGGVSGNPIEVSWTGSGRPAGITAGAIGATAGALNVTMPGYATKLDTVAGSLITAINSQHAAGFDLAGAAGGAFFTGTSASTIAVALSNPSKVAASATSGASLDGTNADRIGGLVRLPGGPDESYRQLIVQLGVAGQSVNRRVDIQGVVTSQVDAARDSTAGVDLDEEMTNLIAFQHAYSGAARLMTAVDEMMDTLINRTGLVGR